MRIIVSEVSFAEPSHANDNVPLASPRFGGNEFISIGELATQLLCRLAGEPVEEGEPVCPSSPSSLPLLLVK